MVFRSLTLTGEQIRAARALGRLEQAELARRSGLSLETIKRLERIRGPVDANSRTLTAISDAFRLIGIEFDTSEGVGVRLVGAEAAVRPVRSAPAYPGAAGVHRLIYYSTMEPGLAPRLMSLLEELRESSRRRNAGLGVTGALLACNGRFLQVIEGEKQAVLQVYGSISSDPRHSNLKILENRPAPARQFSDWHLCCGTFDSDGEMFAQEPAMNEGFRPEALTPASALGLLSVMRDLQRTHPRNLRGVAGRCPLAAQCLDQACVASAA